MNDLEKILEELKSTPRKKSNTGILNRMENHIEGILDAVANDPESINQDRADADIAEFMDMYQELLNISFGKGQINDKTT